MSDETCVTCGLIPAVGWLVCGTCRHAADPLRARLAEVERELADERRKHPNDGPGSHRWDLAEMRAQAARAERAEAEVDRLRAVAEAAREHRATILMRMHPVAVNETGEKLDAALDALAAHAQGTEQEP